MLLIKCYSSGVATGENKRKRVSMSTSIAEASADVCTLYGVLQYIEVDDDD